VKRVLVVAPGRGSYGPRELGTLARAGDAAAPVIAAVDAARAARGLGSIGELDARKTFSPEEHLAAENASALIFACSMADAGAFPSGVEIAGVIGNSLGFYTALAVSGALSLADAARLVVDMAALQTQHGRGRQVMLPVVDESWRPAPEAVLGVKRALAAFSGRAFPSIHLCGFEVLAVADDACEAFLSELPRVRSGGRDYPIVLEGHHGYHSPLVAAVADAARISVRVSFRAPRVPLVDGRGAIFTPWSTDPRELAAYALDHQVREPFDFLASLRTAVRELGPDTLVLLGPGESIGGAIGQGLASDGLFSIHDKDSFQKRQREAPVLLALGRPEQRALFLGAR
jgi:acyl transferase domain-containing protein